MKQPIERRFLPLDNVEVRAEGEREISGYASVFNVEAEIEGWFGGWREEVAPGAYAKTIQESDIRALWNHDTNVVLGRNRAKPSPTLELAEDSHGLRAVIRPPDNEWGRPVWDAIERGDVTGMSIAFRAIKYEWQRAPKGSQELDKRIIREAQLFEVSPVTFPAFEATSVSARAMGDWLTGEDQELAEAVRLLLLAQRGMPLTAEDKGVIAPLRSVLLAQFSEPEPDGHHSEPEAEPGSEDYHSDEDAVTAALRAAGWRANELILKAKEIVP